MKEKSNIHTPVLLEEAIAGLKVNADGVYVDATLGRGGHSKKILENLSSLGHIYAFDQDIEAVETSREYLSAFYPRVTFIHSNFRFFKEKLEQINVQKVDGVLFDLGVSSPQIDDKERGFSYLGENKLDMRMDKLSVKDAQYVVNEYSQDDLCKIIRKYGEEKFAFKIAKKIVEARQEKKIETTRQLVEIIKSSVPYQYFKNSFPSKRVFQAIRIEVNDELESIEEGIEKSLKMLKKGGRVAVITFHSLEDKIVKNIFKTNTQGEVWNKHLPITNDVEPEFKLVNKKVIVPTNSEISKNPRAKSAKLRIIEKV